MGVPMAPMMMPPMRGGRGHYMRQKGAPTDVHPSAVWGENVHASLQLDLYFCCASVGLASVFLWRPSLHERQALTSRSVARSWSLLMHPHPHMQPRLSPSQC